MPDEFVDITFRGDASSAVRAAAAARAAIADLGDESDRLGVSLRRTSELSDGAGVSTGRFNHSVLTMRNSLRLIKWPAMIAGLGGAAQGLSALAAGAVGVTGALAPLSGALVGYPALLGAFGQAAGTVAAAQLGDLQEALAGNEEAMKRLSPAARSLAAEIKGLAPLGEELRAAAQEPLFEGVEKGLAEAIGNFPRLRAVIGATSEAMGGLAAEAGRFLGREGFGRDFEAVGRRNAALLSDMGHAGLALGDALRHVMVAAGPLLDWAGEAIVRMAELTAEEARAGRESGELAEFFEGTKEALQAVGDLLGPLARGLLAVGKAAAPLGEDVLRALTRNAEEFERWAESMRGQNELRDFFADAKPALFEAGRLIAAIGKAFLDLSDDPGLVGFLRAVRKDLLPALQSVVETTTEGFGPVFVDFLKEASGVFETFVESTGPLTLFVELLTEAMRIFNRLIDLVPQLGTALAAAMTLRALGGLRGGRGAGGGGLAGLVGAAGAGAAGARLFGRGGAARGGTSLGGYLAGSEGAARGVGGLAGGLGRLGAVAGRVVAPLAAISGGLEVLTGETRGAGDAVQNFVSGATLGAVQSRATEMGEVFEYEVGTIRDLRRELFQAGASADEFGERFETIRGSLERAREDGDLTEEQFAALSEELDRMGEHAERFARKREEEQQASRVGFGYAAAISRDGEVVKSEVMNMIGVLNRFHGASRKEAADAMIGMAKVLEDKGKLAEGSARRLREAIVEQFGRAKVGSVRETGKMVRGVVTNFAAMAKGIDAGLSWIGKHVDEALVSFGVEPLKLAFSGGIVAGLGNLLGNLAVAAGGGGAGGRQRGGLIAEGRPEGDSVPTWLERGEYVLNRRLVRRVGVDRLDALNFGAAPRRGMQGGGAVGDVAGLGSGILRLAGVLGSRYGMSVTSGVRPGDPGFHGQGLAADFAGGDWTGASRYVNRVGPGLLEGIYNPATFGGFPVSWDSGARVAPSFWGADWAAHWDHIHAAIAGAGGLRGAAAPAAFRPIEPIGVRGRPRAMAEMAEGALARARGAANRYLRREYERSQPGFGYVGGPWVSAMREIARREGWSFADWMQLVMNESGGNPEAVNPSSGAFGLGQFLGSTARQYAPYGALSHDPTRQIAAMAQYVKDRYGDPTQALAFWNAHRWYAEGGYVDRIRGIDRRISEIDELLGRSDRGGEEKGVRGKERERLTSEREELVLKSNRLERRRRSKYGRRRRRFAGMEDWASFVAAGERGVLAQEDWVGRLAAIHQGTDLSEEPTKEELAREEGELRLEVAENEELLGLQMRLRNVLIGGLGVAGKREGKLRRELERLLGLPREKQKGQRWKIGLLKEALGGLRETRGDWRSGLESLHGVSSPMEVFPAAPAPPTLGGQILDTQLQIGDLQAAIGDLADFGTGTEGEDEKARQLAELYREMFERERAERRLGEASFGVLYEFLADLRPFVGAFARGGVVPDTGMALVHRGETVLPAGAAPRANVTLVLNGKAGELVELVDARIEGKAARVANRKIGREARRIAVSPGR